MGYSHSPRQSNLKWNIHSKKSPKCGALRHQVIKQLRGVLGAYRVPAPQTVLYTAASIAKLERGEMPTPELTYGVQT